MKVLVVGSGGREHAVSENWRKTRRSTAFFARQATAASAYSPVVEIKATDVEGMVAFAKKRGLTLLLSPRMIRWCWEWPTR